MKPKPNFMAHLREAITECYRVHSEEELRRAARDLGIEEWMPEPQQELALGRAA